MFGGYSPSLIMIAWSLDRGGGSPTVGWQTSGNSFNTLSISFNITNASLLSKVTSPNSINNHGSPELMDFRIDFRDTKVLLKDGSPLRQMLQPSFLIFIFNSFQFIFTFPNDSSHSTPKTMSAPPKSNK